MDSKLYGVNATIIPFVFVLYCKHEEQYKSMDVGGKKKENC